MRAFCAAITVLSVVTVFLAGCGTPAETPATDAAAVPGEVVIYASVDQHFSEPILKDFERQTGITVKAVYDAEAAKTTGLVNRLIAEKVNPQADIFWSGECVQTVRLQNEGVLAPFSDDNAPLPDGAYYGTGGYYVVYGGRARVFLADRAAFTNLFGNADSLPLSVLLDERLPAARVGIGMPLFGTSSTQGAMLWARDGAGPAADFYRRVKARGVRITDGNASVRNFVVDGQLTIGLTDGDDAASAIQRAGDRLVAVPVYPPLVIPMTAARIAGRPANAAVRQLADYIVSVETRTRLEREGFLSAPAGKMLAEVSPQLLAATAAAFPAAQEALREMFAR